MGPSKPAARRGKLPAEIDGEIEMRDNHSLRVLHRQTDGSWLIASEMYNDANREQTYSGNS